MAASQPYDIIAFAVYSADDNSLTFYKEYDYEVPTAGTTHNGKTATAIYTGIENTNYTATTDQAWNAYNTVITNVSFIDEIAPTSTAFWFSGFTNLARVNNPENLDTSNVTSMRQMFTNCSSLTAAMLIWDTLSVTDMGFMFYGCNNLEILRLGLDTDNVTNMESMFSGCESLTGITVGGAGNWNTSKVTNMTEMFNGCSSLKNLDVSNWNTSNVTDMSFMFYGCSALTTLDVSNWDTGNVTNMNSIFSKCINLTNLDVSNWNTSSVTVMSFSFSQCTKLATLDVSRWNIGNVALLDRTFQACEALTTLNVSNWDTKSVTDLNGTFYGCKNITSLDVSNWNTSNVTNMRRTFGLCSALITLNVASWDTSNVTTMEQMFYKDKSLSSLDVSNWDTYNVTNMLSMFRNCYALTELDVSNWDTGSVTTMQDMFGSEDYGYVKWNLKTLDVSKWNTSNVTDMLCMFYGFNGPSTLDVSGFDTSKVTTFNHMFAHSKLTLIGIENWDTSSAINMNAMFHTCMNKSFDVSNFNTSKVTTFTQMFQNCWNATEIKGLENFDTSNGIDFQEMFLNCEKLKYLDLSSFDTSKAVDGAELADGYGTSATCLNMLGSAELPLKRLEKLILGEKFRFGGSGATTTNKAKLHTPSSEFVKYADGNWYSEDGTAYSATEIPDGVYGVYYTSPCGVPKKYSIEFGTLKRIANATRDKTATTEEILTENLPEAILSIKGSVGGTATAAEIFLDKTAYVNGEKLTGEFTIDTELNEQDNLLNQIETALTNKVGGDFDAGYKAYYDEFWDNYQENGNRENYDLAFGAQCWNDSNFKPKYDMRPAAASRMFSACKITNLKKLLQDANVILDLSNMTVMVYFIENPACTITHLPELNVSRMGHLKYFLYQAQNLVSVDKIILKNDGSQEFADTSFGYAQKLQEIRFEGIIGKTVSFKWSTLLTKASIESIISCLSTSSSGQTLTLSKTAINKAFETSSGANDGSTSAEWNLLINGDGTATNPGRTNWTITLV